MKESRQTRTMAVMNYLWFFLIVIAILIAATNGRLHDLTNISFKAAEDAVKLAIGLIGAMALWLGLIKIAEAGGLMQAIARAIRPVMQRLFPDVPAEDPAMSAMIMNISANALGLGNAATPLGIKAMMALNRLNRIPGTATDAMCLFLAINTSSVTLFPLGVISMRAAAGAKDPSSILVPTILSTCCSTIVAIAAAKLLKRRQAHKFSEGISTDETVPADPDTGATDEGALSRKQTGSGPSEYFLTRWLTVLSVTAFLGIILWRIFTGTLTAGNLQDALIPAIMLGLIAYGLYRQVPVYEIGAEGAREGFDVAVRIIPFLVLILVAVGMFRASGAFEVMSFLLKPVTDFLDIPPDVIPVALLRPLSGSGAFALVSEITLKAPDSFAAFLAGTIQGSTETTFYVLAVYFGSVSIFRARYAVAAALLADFAGFAAAVIICHALFNG